MTNPHPHGSSEHLLHEIFSGGTDCPNCGEELCDRDTAPCSCCGVDPT